MNWTGGSLQRTKQANKGVLQQQKAYFARAQTQLQNTTNSSAAPFRPSYLQDNENSGLWTMTPFGSGSVRHTGHAAKRPSERTQREPTTEEVEPIRKDHETLPREQLHSDGEFRLHKGSSGDLLLTSLSDIKTLTAR
jgi:hypothetical protein